MTHDSHNRAALVFKLLGLTVAVVVAVGLQASERSSLKSDLYGYALSTNAQSADCDYDYVDLARSGQELTLVAGHAKAAADDRVAVLELARPFELYQSPSRSLVVSEHGYLAVADPLKVEDGSEFSNDCSLPAQAVLYHGSHGIALQYASVDDSGAARATVGLQGFDGRTARQASCNTGGQVSARQAICFHDPRRQPIGGGSQALPARH